MGVEKVLVIGGGITGSMACLALTQRGAQVELVEIRPDWHGSGHGITIQGNALRAFRTVGVLDEVLANSFPSDSVRLCHADGSLIAEPSIARTGGPDLPATIGSLRSVLQEILRKAVHDAGVQVRLGLTVERLEQPGDRVEVTFTDGSTGGYDLVVGADGIRSKVRRLLGIPTEPTPVGQGIFRVVTDRPAGSGCGEMFYGPPGFKAGYTIISPEQCYAYLLDEPIDPADVRSRGSLAAFMRERSAGYGGNWGRLRETISDDMPVDYRWIESLLVDDPWYRGRVILIGDAAHACPPQIAQGAAMCAEDAIVLAELVTGTEPAEPALSAFMRRRLPRVRMVVENSVQLATWEIRPDTPGADAGRVMAETLAALQSPP